LAIARHRLRAYIRCNCSGLQPTGYGLSCGAPTICCGGAPEVGQKCSTWMPVVVEIRPNMLYLPPPRARILYLNSCHPVSDRLSFEQRLESDLLQRATWSSDRVALFVLATAVVESSAPLQDGPGRCRPPSARGGRNDCGMEVHRPSLSPCWANLDLRRGAAALAQPDRHRLLGDRLSLATRMGPPLCHKLGTTSGARRCDARRLYRLPIAAVKGVLQVRRRGCGKCGQPHGVVQGLWSGGADRGKPDGGPAMDVAAVCPGCP
jgi:hypothetical protein